MSDFPLSVNEYSTFGGICGILLAMNKSVRFQLFQRNG